MDLLSGFERPSVCSLFELLDVGGALHGKLDESSSWTTGL
jgi:hypothetical protein